MTIQHNSQFNQRWARCCAIAGTPPPTEALAVEREVEINADDVQSIMKPMCR